MKHSVKRGSCAPSCRIAAALLPLLAVSAHGQTATLSNGGNYSNLGLPGYTFAGTAQNATFLQSNLTNARFASGFALNSANFNYTNLTNASLPNANLTGAQMQFTYFTGANLTGAILDNALIVAFSTPAYKISAAQLRSVASASGTTLAGNYAGYDLTGVNFANAIFTSADLTNVNFTNATLTGASFSNDLGGVNFTGANLTGANLSGKSMANANFTNANATGVNLSGSTLTGATFSGTRFTNANLGNVTLGGNVTRNNDFTGATLAGTTLGNAASFAGFVYDNNLTISSGTTTLNSAGFATLGSLTEMGGGTLAAANGVTLGTGRAIAGHGTVQGKVAAVAGATIAAQGGDLTLGNASSAAGYFSDGELYTGTNTVTLLDGNQAVLGSYTQVGSGGSDGTLISDNGLLVDFGRNLTGQGIVTGTNTLATATIINGAVVGTGTGLTFTGYVKGAGTFEGPVTFAGTFSPGNSPTQTQTSGFTLLNTSTLIMEIGGTSAGSQFDQIVSTGTIALDGVLQVDLINGFVPADGTSYQLFNYGTAPTGIFSSINLPTLAENKSWDTSSLYSAGVVSVVPEPSAWGLSGLGASLLLLRRRRLLVTASTSSPRAFSRS